MRSGPLSLTARGGLAGRDVFRWLSCASGPLFDADAVFLPENDGAFARLQEVEGVDLADGLGGSGNCDETELACGIQDGVAIGRVEDLNFVEEEWNLTIVPLELAFEEEEIEENLDGDGGPVGFDLPEVVVRMCPVVRADDGKGERE